MSKFIHPITLEAAYEVASNLRPEDRRECEEGHGIVPTIHIPLASLSGFCVYFNVPNGRIAGLAGIQEQGKIWMLTTSAIYDYPIHFASTTGFDEHETDLMYAAPTVAQC